MTELSVIIPARNAAATLKKTIAALGAQDWGGDFEVILVDDASTDATPDLAEEAGLTVVRQDRQQGAAAARNAGAAAASGAVLAFTDSDCEPPPGWLRAAVRGLEEADLVTGPILPVPGATAGTFDRTLRVEAESPLLFESANVVVRRELFERIGGFPAFGIGEDDAGPGLRPKLGEAPFGEDVRFGWEARRCGARVRFVSEALVHHAVFPRGPRGYIAERKRVRYFPALIRDLPELRTVLTLRIFLSPRSALFDAAVAGVVAGLARRRPWPLLAAVPYVAKCLRTADPWRRSAARENLALMAGDAVVLVSLVRGSAAARRVVL
jgi:glycosyltransferase involved in cell wall biosynthesis